MKSIPVKKTFCILATIITIIIIFTSVDTLSHADAPALLDNGIPVLSLTVNPDEFQKVIDSSDHSYRAPGGMVNIIYPERYINEYTGEPKSGTETLKLEYIRGRGNSTWKLDKKPFKIKLSKKASIAGMEKTKHWVLLANAADTTLLNDRLVGYLGEKFRLSTPQFVSVDLVINERYLGNYLLAQQVRVGNHNLDIDELLPDENTKPEITGGYLLGLCPYMNEPPENTFTTSHGVSFKLDTPQFGSTDPEDALGSSEQREYITGFLQNLEDALYGEDFKSNDGVRYSDYLDLSSAARYFWVQDFVKNNDAYSTPSTYLYKTRDNAEKDGKLFFGPLWDFDYALTMAVEENQIDGFGHRSMNWLDYMRQNDPFFQKELLETWSELDGILENVTKDGGVLDGYATEIRESWRADYAINKNPDAGETTLDNEIAKLKTFIDGRRKWINDHLDELFKAYCTITFEADGLSPLTRTIKYGGELETYELPNEQFQKEGYIFVGWKDNNGDFINSTVTNIKEDMTLTATYLDINDAVLPTDLYFAFTDIWIPAGMYGYSIGDYCTIMPKDVDDASITWQSSDDTIAEIENNSVLNALGVGTATITGKALSGATVSFTVHIYDQEKPVATDYDIGFELNTIILMPGEHAQNTLLFSINDSPIEPRLTFVTDNESVVSVDNNGVIYAVAPGSAVISVTDAVTGATASYTVNVSDKQSQFDVPAPHITEPGEPTAESVVQKNANANVGSTEKTGGSGAPKTGDESGIASWSAVFAASLIGIIFVTVFEKRKKENKISKRTTSNQ